MKQPTKPLIPVDPQANLVTASEVWRTHKGCEFPLVSIIARLLDTIDALQVQIEEAEQE